MSQRSTDPAGPAVQWDDHAPATTGPTAGARDGNHDAAQPQPHAPDTAAPSAGADEGAVKKPEPAAQRWRQWGAEAKARWTPPDVVRHDRPSLQKQWGYARHGEWTTQSGVWRWAGCVYALVIAVPVTVTAYYLAWICERPSRLLAAALLLTVFAQVPPLSWLV